MPLHFYTDRRVLNVAGLSPIANAALGALEALKVSCSEPDSLPHPPPAAYDAASKSPGMGTNIPPSPEGHLSSSSPLLGQIQSPLPPAKQVPSAALGDVGGQHSATVIL
ncbi:hypothetical protein LIER_43498 [Lithospermum erythrorhizon]|uniref:Uncharacterized protein n=1 Tax=Lithospermum erythrorhizon TaxID=34254 RepID=A0AAV3Q7X0_LITER